MLYRILRPNANASVTDIIIEAPTLPDAFEQFKTRHWYPVSTVTLAAWCGERIAGHIEIGEDGPVLRDLDPPRQQSLACGD